MMTMLTFIVSSLLLNAHSNKSDRKYHHESEYDKYDSQPNRHLYK